MLVYLVRHAVALKRSEWPELDAHRPLAKKGMHQAQRLAIELARVLDPSRDRLYSSPSKRCIDTLGPLSDRLGVPIKLNSLLGDKDSGAPVPPDVSLYEWLSSNSLRFIDRIRSDSNETATVVAATHGDVLACLLEQLLPNDALLTSGAANEKGSYWRLRFDDERCADATYHPAV